MVWLSYHKHLFFVLQSKFKVETFGFFLFYLFFVFYLPSKSPHPLGGVFRRDFIDNPSKML